MTKISDGEGARAFPRRSRLRTASLEKHGQAGMSLRDWFAGQAYGKGCMADGVNLDETALCC